MAWAVTEAKAKFSGLLDAAAGGPQVIRRRKETFILTTEAELEKRLAEARSGKRKKFVSAWDALRPPFPERFDIDFPRVKSVPRAVDFE